MPSLPSKNKNLILVVRNDTQTDCEAFSSRPILLELFDIVSQILSAIVDAACNSIYKNRNKNDSLLGSLDIGLFVTLEAWFQLFTFLVRLNLASQLRRFFESFNSNGSQSD